MPQNAQTQTEQTETVIVSFIRDELVGDKSLTIDLDENLLTGGLVDSVGVMRLIAHIRDRLNVTVPPQDLIPSNFRTIRIMAAYLQSRMEAE